MEWIALYLLGVGVAKAIGPNPMERYIGFIEQLFGVSDTNQQENR